MNFFHRNEDILQIPLQPLYNNLDTYTYEIFEKDPVKYIFYQNAIEKALRDKISQDEIKTKTVIFYFSHNGIFERKINKYFIVKK